MGRYDAPDEHLLEAIMSPVLTRQDWILSCESLEAVAAFSFAGCPIPRTARLAYIRRLLLKDNCKRVIFWSKAGKSTLHSYGHLPADDPLLNKVTVVYPAIRRVADELVQYRVDDEVSLLFAGEFFRKGGVNVVDAFERVRRIHRSVTLTLCCDPEMDFKTPNTTLRTEYLSKINRTEGIVLRGWVPREEFIRTVLPRTDIYLLPTYYETFGMGILEAMAFGFPVIATNHFAIPEMLDDRTSGLLIDTNQFDTARLFRGYVVRDIPRDFREHVTTQLFALLCDLIGSPELRERLGRTALGRARTTFSFETRNEKMVAIYRDAVD